jgi:serine/threonine protein kinase
MAELPSRRYKMLSHRLGTGSYGEVYLAVDKVHQRQVACKIIPLPPQDRRAVGPNGTTAMERRKKRRSRYNGVIKEVQVSMHLNHVSIQGLRLFIAHSFP